MSNPIQAQQNPMMQTMQTNMGNINLNNSNGLNGNDHLNYIKFQNDIILLDIHKFVHCSNGFDESDGCHEFYDEWPKFQYGCDERDAWSTGPGSSHKE